MIFAVQQQPAAGRRQKTGDQAQQGAFTGAAGAEHRDALARLNAQIKAHRQVFIQVGQFFKRQHGAPVSVRSG